MGFSELFFAIGGIGLGIISYFLRGALNELREVKEMAIDTKQKLAVLETDYINKVAQLNEKIDDLQDVIKELTKELKEYNNKIK